MLSNPTRCGSDRGPGHKPRPESRSCGPNDMGLCKNNEQESLVGGYDSRV